MPVKSVRSALLSALICGFVPFAAPSASFAESPPKPRPPHEATGADTPSAEVAASEPAPLTRGLAGPYLAARLAVYNNDFRAAATYFDRALAQDHDDPILLDSGLVSMLSAGDVARADKLSRDMLSEGRGTDLAALVHRAALAKAGEWQALIAFMEETPPPQDGPEGGRLLDGMLKAWAELGDGRASDAIKTFEAQAKTHGAAPVVNYHLALAKAFVGDFEGAEALLADPETGVHLQGVIARAQILAQLDRRADAVKMIDALPGVQAEPVLVKLREDLQTGAEMPFTAVRTAQEGVAQVLLTFASALASVEEPDPLALIQARLATWLAPDLAEARLLAAQLLQAFGQYDLAEDEYKALREQGEIRPVAELARIDALARADRKTDAEQAALALVQVRPDLSAAWVALGDLQRQQDKFDEAIASYDKAIELLRAEGDPQALWFPVYARGIARERSGKWDQAEGDFKEALSIQPEHPHILNYLGYSYIDRNENLDEALELIKKAHELKPGDGYITDSLAWAYYRLGRYQDAVAPMEEAASLMPQDSLVNDHLGDIYWMAGRKREASFQWKRALSLDPETEEDAHRIRMKLERGLDAVLEEEKAHGGKLPPPPIPPADEVKEAAPVE